MYYEAASGQSNADSPLNGLLGNDTLPSSSGAAAGGNTATSCKIDWVSACANFHVDFMGCK